MKKLMTCLLVLFMSAGLAMADGSFHVVAESFSTTVFDLTPDGTWAAGTNDGQVYRWSEATGTELLSPAEWLWTHTAGISDDGTQIASTVEYGDRVFGPALWTEGGDWMALDTLYPDPPYQGGDDWSFGSGYDISGDGSAICGLAWHPEYKASGFSWTADGGIVDLGRPVDRSARASKISADGSTVVGFWEHESFGNRRPVRWVDGGAADLFLGAETWGESMGCTSDGSMITGQVGFNESPGYGYALAFVYSDDDGYTDLGLLPGHDPVFSQSSGTAISDNGIVVGYSGETGPWGVLEPFVWTEADGMMLLDDYLTDNGVTIPANIDLTSANAISANGTTIGGQALNLDNWMYVAWVAKIDAPVEAQTFQVTMTGTVEWNQVDFGSFAGVNAGDPVTLTFQVSSDDYLDSTTYSTRGYAIDQDSYSLTLGSVTEGLQNPYPDGHIPYFVIRNDDPGVDGFFIADNNVDWPWPGLPLDETGIIGEPFASHFEVGYEVDTLSSFDILDAVGIYDYTGLTNFYFVVSDLGMDAIGLDFTQMEIGVAGGSFDATITCLEPELALPGIGAVQMEVTNLTADPISVSGGVYVTLCNGNEHGPFYSRTVNLDGYATKGFMVNRSIPALYSTCNCDLVFTVKAQDEAVGDILTDSCTVTTTCQ